MEHALDLLACWSISNGGSRTCLLAVPQSPAVRRQAAPSQEWPELCPCLALIRMAVQEG